ncbi:hypothetical protein Agabi119p4_8383 [Agaricus bisporus var. burnettii]|uniref:Uncharacterized protein n=1 Tax=Agaricus bisporus var. burnettii TaxID=192524 RepID=A0A8H7EYP5_AGABI|nr:hypothetical protein Agabi119p4_8383 [Agaricus bisporus var. burnettii]
MRTARSKVQYSKIVEDNSQADMAQAAAPEAGDIGRNQFPAHQVETKDERAREAGGEVTVSSRGLDGDGFGDFEHVHERIPTPKSHRNSTPETPIEVNRARTAA